METLLKYSVGIDCGKKEIVAAMILVSLERGLRVKGTRKFRNTINGFNDCKLWILHHKKHDLPVTITMEATGNYHENLAFYFHEEKYPVSIILANKAKKYFQSLGLKSKNDKIDAKGLAQMGAEQRLPLWKPFSKEIYDLRMLTRYYEQLSNNRTIFMNQLSSIQAGKYQIEEVINGLKRLIADIDSQLKEVKNKIDELVCKDKKMKERFEKILLIKGVGQLTLATIIAETNGFELFDNERQLTSYAGYDVIENQSGKRIGKTRISKKGNSHIRRIMHMPALNVVRFGEDKFVHLYDRIMKRTCIKMKAYIAIQRKLLCLIFHLWKNDCQYDPRWNYSSGNAEKDLFFLQDPQNIKKQAE